MASNDMNSWDDPSERLRQRWQQAFANFEVQPRSSLNRRVLDPLTTKHRRKQIRRLLVVGLLLLISGGLIYQVRSGKRLGLSKINSINVTHTVPVGSEPANAVHPSAPSARRSISLKRPATSSQAKLSRQGQQSTAFLPTISEMNVTRARTLKKTPIVEAPALDRQFVTKQIPRRSLLKTNIQPRSERVKNTFPKSVYSTNILPLAESVSSTATVRHKPTLETVGQSNNPSAAPQSLAIRSAANVLPIDWTQLKPHGMLPLRSSLSILPGLIHAYDLKLSHLEKSSTVRRHLNWFVDAIPLSSFQWMSAPPTSTAYLSQVHAPAAFSPATWGYQFNGGLQWHRWQAYLSMGQLRRWAYYTVNENRYRVEPSPANPDQLVRETYAITEDVLLPMIGAGISRQTFLAQDRYLVELGGQLSYLPTSDQTLIGLRGGVDRRLAMNRGIILQVGLTVEYGLNRLLSEQKQLAIHPLVLGFRFRLQPRLGNQNQPH